MLYRNALPPKTSEQQHKVNKQGKTNKCPQKRQTKKRGCSSSTVNETAQAESGGKKKTANSSRSTNIRSSRTNESSKEALKTAKLAAAAGRQPPPPATAPAPVHTQHTSTRNGGVNRTNTQLLEYQQFVLCVATNKNNRRRGRTTRILAWHNGTLSWHAPLRATGSIS